MNEQNMTLDRDTVVKAIEHKSPGAVPTCMCMWWGEGLREQYGNALDDLEARYPDDVVKVYLPLIDWEGTPYSWRREETGDSHGLDSDALLPDWRYLDEFIECSPKPEDLDFSEARQIAEEAHSRGQYVMAGFWRFFFERPWGIRGMENIMLDYYDHPEEVHKLHSYLRDVYQCIIRRTAEEVKADGFQTSDDLGNQQSLNMTPGQFKEFIKPFYLELVPEVHRLGMHFWLHSCGNNTDVMEDLIEAGVDMFHPVQKHTMDWPETVERFGGRIGFWAGFDVQHTLQEAGPDEVRAEVRHMIDMFGRAEGGMVLAAGNGITAGTPLENIEAFLDEAHGPAAGR